MKRRIMNIMRHSGKAATVLSALLSICLYPGAGSLSRVFAARFVSDNFSDVNGSCSYGSRYGYSPNFENNGAAQEAAVSTSQAGAFSGRSGALAYYPQPAPVNDLALVTVSSYSLRISWTAPAADWYRNAGGVSGYILRYTSAAPLSTDAAFLAAQDVIQSWTPLAVGLRDSRVIEGFNPGTTYYFAIESVNGHQLRSEISGVAGVFAVVPLAPLNFRLTSSADSVALSWMPPVGFINRMPFDDRFSPIYPYEVQGYQVFRATAPAGAEWTALYPEASFDTFGFADNTVEAGRTYYYCVKAFNRAGFSPPSHIRGSGGNSLYFAADDNAGFLEIPEEGAKDFVSAAANPEPMDFYTVNITSHAEDVSGRVLKSVEFAAYRGGIRKDETFKLAKPATLKIYYLKSGGASVPAGEASADVGLYYYNGSRWLQFYGRVDKTDNDIELKTAMLGKYQVRSVARSASFSADAAGLSNRLLTPNGDGKNDNMVFVFDNPMDAGVKGRIYDMRGAYVAKMSAGPVGNSLAWDAKSGGQAVPGGVYIYQIESGGKVYNGTVAVIK